MLQLVQSPSQRVQRLIEKECRIGRDGSGGNRASLTSSSAKNGPSKAGNNIYKERPGAEDKTDQVDEQEDGFLEGRVRDVDSIDDSNTSSDRRGGGGDVAKVRRVINPDGSLIVASSSYSSSSPTNRDSAERDDGTETDEPDYGDDDD